MMGKTLAEKPKQQSKDEIDKGKKTDVNKAKKVKQISQKKLVQTTKDNGQSSNNTSNIVQLKTNLDAQAVNVEEQAIGDGASNWDALLGSPQHGRNSVVTDHPRSTSKPQKFKFNSPLNTQVVEILQDIVETSSKADTSNSKGKSATIEEEVTNLNLHKGKALLIEDKAIGTITNKDIHSMHIDSLDITEGQESKSKDELDLVMENLRRSYCLISWSLIVRTLIAKNHSRYKNGRWLVGYWLRSFNKWKNCHLNMTSK
ncbi:hypothetical protein ACH5RR_015590 [Cinchona calisaya]|uniref:Uncharacterized protein n=1 Tax=Cinchona calisaya TaxID=153742 RepID=A0ABD2ZTL5_9GENT